MNLSFKLVLHINDGTPGNLKSRVDVTEVHDTSFTVMYDRVIEIMHEPGSAVYLAFIEGIGNEHFCGFGPYWNRVSANVR